MGRSNVIIVGSVVLAPLILGVESYALFRSHHHRVAPVAETQLEAPAPPPTVVATPPPVQPAETLTDDVAAALPGPLPETPPPSLPSPLEHRRQAIRAADEEAFDLLNFPNAQRSAIRAIDDAYVRAPRAGDAFGPDGVDQARRTAIAAVLGPNAMRAFGVAERKAERRMRRHLRSQSVSQR